MSTANGASGGRRGGRGTAGAPSFALAALAVLALAAACGGDVPAGDVTGDGRPPAARSTDALVSAGDAAARVAAHRLTEGRVERWFAAQERLERLFADDPGLERRLAGPAGRDGRPIEAAAARLAAEPAVREAIEDEGLEVDDFVLTGLALHQALLAAGPGAPPALRRTAARNVRFVTANAHLLRRFASPRRDPLAYDDREPDDADWALYGPPLDTAVALGDVDTLAPPPDDPLAPTEPPEPPPADSLPPAAPDSLPPPPAPAPPAAPPAAPPPPR